MPPKTSAAHGARLRGHSLLRERQQLAVQRRRWRCLSAVRRCCCGVLQALLLGGVSVGHDCRPASPGCWAFTCARRLCMRTTSVCVSAGNASGTLIISILAQVAGGRGCTSRGSHFTPRLALACSCTVLRSKSRELPPSESLSAANGNIASQCHPAGLSLVGCRSWPSVTLSTLAIYTLDTSVTGWEDQSLIMIHCQWKPCYGCADM